MKMEFGKTFTCTCTGCDMTFTTQESLTVHKRNHLTLLNFDNGSKGNSCVDQTPTPTRFIRNCEEVGLFQDLQNVNPFEETFRKANEAGGGSRLVEIDLEALPNTDDTLHTPPFYPNITGQVNASSSAQTTANNGSDDSISEIVEVPSNGYLNNKRSEYSNGATHMSETLKNTHSRRRNRNRVVSTEATSASKGQFASNGASNHLQRVRPIAPHPSAQFASTGTLQSTSTGYNQQQNTLASTKLVLRNSLLNTKRPISPSNRSSPAKKVFRSPSVAPQVEKQTTEEEKRLFRERNRCGNLSRSSLTDDSRVAASRCREKRKIWVEGLETKIKVLQTTNNLREAEIVYLRKELQKYKDTLLKHRDCSVTRAENEGGTGALAGTYVFAPLQSSQVIHQKTDPAAQVVNFEKKLSPISSDAAKASRSAPIKMAQPRILGQPNKTLTLSAAGHLPDSVPKVLAKTNLQNSGITFDRSATTSRPSRDPLLSSAVARDSVTDCPPIAIPIIKSLASPTTGQSFLKKSPVTSVNDPSKIYILNVPVAQTRSEPANTNNVAENIFQVPNSKVIILVNKLIKTESDASSQTIEVPEINIIESDEVASSLDKSSNSTLSVGNHRICPCTAHDVAPSMDKSGNSTSSAKDAPTCPCTAHEVTTSLDKSGNSTASVEEVCMCPSTTASVEEVPVCPYTVHEVTTSLDKSGNSTASVEEVRMCPSTTASVEEVPMCPRTLHHPVVVVDDDDDVIFVQEIAQ